MSTTKSAPVPPSIAADEAREVRILRTFVRGFPSFHWYERLKGHVRSVMKQPKQPASGPIKISIQWFVERPDSLLSPEAPKGAILCHDTTDDANEISEDIERSIFKALRTIWQGIGLWESDAQICDRRFRKFYTGSGDPAGVWITVTELTRAPVHGGLSLN